MKLVPISLFFVIFLVVTSAVAQDESVIKQLARVGRDGSDIYYTVRCKSGDVGSIVLRADQLKICVSSPSIAEDCRADWNLEQAGKRLCESE